MNKSEALSHFQKSYADLTELNRDKFAELANRLLQTNYYVEQKANIEDFRFFMTYQSLFEAYFAFIDIDFFIDRTYRYVGLSNVQKGSKLRLNKFESQVLLTLRFLFQKKFSEVTLSDDVAIYYSELNAELERTGALKDKLKKVDIAPVLRRYRDFNLIDYIAKDITENNDARITIYPTILSALKYEDIQELLAKYESYNKGDKRDEEADEDQAD